MIRISPNSVTNPIFFASVSSIPVAEIVDFVLTQYTYPELTSTDFTLTEDDANVLGSTIRGKITLDGNTISGADVVILEADNDELENATLFQILSTDENGKFISNSTNSSKVYIVSAHYVDKEEPHATVTKAFKQS
jgi:hypothetical protein